MAMFFSTQDACKINRQLYNEGKSYTVWDALAVNDFNAFKSLVQSCDPNATNKNGQTLVLIAAKSGSYRCLSLLIDLGASVCKKDLNAALENSHYNCVQLLLSILETNEKKNSEPIEEKKDYDDEVRQMKNQLLENEKLLKQQQSIIKQQQSFMNKMIFAPNQENNNNQIKKPDMQKVKHLNYNFSISLNRGFTLSQIIEILNLGLVDKLKTALTKGMDPDIIFKYETTQDSSPRQMTPSLLCAEKGYHRCLSLLIEYGADINFSFEDDLAPVHAATNKNNTKCLDVLIKAKANINKVTMSGDTPIHIAVLCSHGECLDMLIAAKADINKATKLGTPTSLAAECGSYDCLQTLINAKAHINARVYSEYARGFAGGFTTAAHLATVYGHLNCLKLLIQAGASPNSVDGNRMSLLHSASRLYFLRYTSVRTLGRPRCLEFLISAKANINTTTFGGFNPVTASAAGGCSECLSILIKAGANVNKANSKTGETPVYYAVKSRQVDCLKILIKHGANVNKASKEGQSPLELAKKSNYQDCVKILKDAGAGGCLIM